MDLILFPCSSASFPITMPDDLAYSQMNETRLFSKYGFIDLSETTSAAPVDRPGARRSGPGIRAGGRRLFLRPPGAALSRFLVAAFSWQSGPRQPAGHRGHSAAGR